VDLFVRQGLQILPKNDHGVFVKGLPDVVCGYFGVVSHGHELPDRGGFDFASQEVLHGSEVLIEGVRGYPQGGVAPPELLIKRTAPKEREWTAAI
jgi:hypothetical protein